MSRSPKCNKLFEYLIRELGVNGFSSRATKANNGTREYVSIREVIDISDRKLGLKEVLDCLRTEIQEIREEIEKGQRERMFDLGQFKIRLGVAIDRKARAGVNVWIVDAGTDVSKVRTHEVEITMNPTYDYGAE